MIVRNPQIIPVVNNFYGWEMRGLPPYEGFTWVKNVDDFDVLSVNDGNIGYLLEVDLEYPEKLHDLHNDYPLAPEILAVNCEMLSDYCSEIIDRYQVKVGDVKKLIPNLSDKKNYVVHCKNLQLYLMLGLKLKKIWGVLKFKQSDCMKEYIDFNTEKRKNASNNFEKDVFKLMINSVYGRTMENLRKRINVQLVNNGKDVLKNKSRATCITYKIFGKNFAAIYEIRLAVTLNKSI